MKVKIKDKVYNADDEPIMLIFENDEERIQVIKHLTDMEFNPGKIRKYCMYNEKQYSTGVIREFMRLDKDIIPFID